MKQQQIDEVIQMVREQQSFATIWDTIAKHKIKGTCWLLVGTCKGVSESGFPTSVDTYHTHNWGQLQNFYRGAPEGSVVKRPDGRVYKVVATYDVAGDATMPAKSMWFAVLI